MSWFELKLIIPWAGETGSKFGIVQVGRLGINHRRVEN
jgi:hypothetical protein